MYARIKQVSQAITVSIVGDLHNGTLNVFYNDEEGATEVLHERIQEGNEFNADNGINLDASNFYYIEHIKVQSQEDLDVVSIRHNGGLAQATIDEDLAYLFE